MGGGLREGEGVSGVHGQLHVCLTDHPLAALRTLGKGLRVRGHNNPSRLGEKGVEFEKRAASGESTPESDGSSPHQKRLAQPHPPVM